MIEWLKNFYFLFPACNVTTSLLQSFYCHLLSSTIIGWVIPAESHLSKVTLEREREGRSFHSCLHLLWDITTYAGSSVDVLVISHQGITSQNSPLLSLESLSESVYWIYPDPCQGGFHLAIYQDLRPKKSHYGADTRIQMPKEVKIYTFVHELWEFSEHNAKRRPVHGVVSQARVDEVGHLLGGEDRQATFLLVKALFLYKSCKK